jgi:leucyl aminopeptidase (aminopeptidase T)
MAATDQDLQRAAHVALTQCMGVSSGEAVLILTDEELRDIAYSLWREARDLGAESVLVEMIERTSHGEEPPAMIASLMKAADVILAPTSKSLSHTAARREANKAAARVATLPGITREMMARTLSADYSVIAEMSRKMAGILTAGNVAQVTSPSGTDITVCIDGQEASADTGIYSNPGDFGNLPAGEAYIAPVEGRSSGVIVIDGSMSGLGVLKNPIRMRVEDGYATEILGGSEAKILTRMLEPFGRPARNIAELGVGTNHQASITGLTLEDEKVLGTIHIALGNNASFGGPVDVPIHLDGIILRPTLTIDGETILENGVMLVE